MRITTLFGPRNSFIEPGPKDITTSEDADDLDSMCSAHIWDTALRAGKT